MAEGNSENSFVNGSMNPGDASSVNVNALLKRGYLALEDGDWKTADNFFEQCLNCNAELAEAYLGKLMSELGVATRDGLKNFAIPFDNRNNYQKALRFADDELKAFLENTVKGINERNENNRLERIYMNAIGVMNSATTMMAFKSAADIFEGIKSFKNSEALAADCREKAEVARKNAIYDSACSVLVDTNGGATKKNDIKVYEHAIAQIRSISGWRDSEAKIEELQQKIEEVKKLIEEEKAELDLKKERDRIAKEKTNKRLLKAAIIVLIIGVVITVAAAVTVYMLYQSSSVAKYEYISVERDSVIITGVKKEDKVIDDGVLSIPYSILGKCVSGIDDDAFDGLKFDSIKYEGTIDEWRMVENSEDFDDCLVFHNGDCYYGEWMLKEGYDCEKGGSEIRYCVSCEAEDSRSVSPTEHSFEEIDGVDPTCTEDGYSSCSICTVCDATTDRETIPALGHTVVKDAAKEATCTKTGLTEGSHCSVCDEVIVKQNVIQKVEHTPVTDAAKAPTCTEKGLTEGSHCSVCDEVIVKQNSVDAKGHSFGAWQVSSNPTCTQNGYDKRVCSSCFYAETRAVSPKGHSYSNKYCTVCGVRQPSEGLTYSAYGSGYALAGLGNCTDTDVVIADTYNGKPVVAISSRAFDDVSWMTSIVIPNTVKEIGSYAFYKCTALTEVRIPNSVTEIGYGTFSGCSSLKRVYFGTGVKSVDRDAFYNCDVLTEVHISDVGSFAAIEFEIFGSPFYGYSKKVNLYVNGAYTTNITVAGTVKVIGSYAFSDCSSIQNVTIAYGVQEISSFAFNDCSSITSLTIPTSVTSIGMFAFDGCNKLKDVVYQGTRAQWRQVSRGGFNFSAKIHCTDGIIE